MDSARLRASQTLVGKELALLAELRGAALDRRAVKQLVLARYSSRRRAQDAGRAQVADENALHGREAPRQQPKKQQEQQQRPHEREAAQPLRAPAPAPKEQLSAEIVEEVVVDDLAFPAARRRVTRSEEDKPRRPLAVLAVPRVRHLGAEPKSEPAQPAPVEPAPEPAPARASKIKPPAPRIAADQQPGVVTTRTGLVNPVAKKLADAAADAELGAYDERLKRLAARNKVVFARTDEIRRAAQRRKQDARRRREKDAQVKKALEEMKQEIIGQQLAAVGDTVQDWAKEVEQAAAPEPQEQEQPSSPQSSFRVMSNSYSLLIRDDPTAAAAGENEGDIVKAIADEINDHEIAMRPNGSLPSDASGADDDDSEQPSEYELGSPYRSILQHAEKRLGELQGLHARAKLEAQASAETVTSTARASVSATASAGQLAKRRLGKALLERVRLDAAFMASPSVDDETVALVTGACGDIFRERVLRPVIDELDAFLDEYVRDMFNAEFVVV